MSATSTQFISGLLRERILEGTIAPGSLLRQDALARELGVSRTPLRTALAELARDGLVTYEANHGFAVRTFDLADIRSAFEVRANLEGLACRLAAKHGLSDEALDRLRECVAEGDSILSKGVLGPEHLPRYRQMNVTFHDTIISAARNSWIRDFVTRTHNVPLASDRVILWESFDIIHRSHDDHHRILKALSAGDGHRAENLIWEHVTYAYEVLVDYLKSGRYSSGNFSFSQNDKLETA